MDVAIRFVGGPADGRTYAIPDAAPPPLYRVPLAPSLGEMLATPLEPSPTRTAEYEPLWENGSVRRADDGAYLYRYRATPLTAEERQVLARRRQEAKAAEERRAAETDEAWKRIRKERPDYPENWRDLF